jgi:hypothetical protein
MAPILDAGCPLGRPAPDNMCDALGEYLFERYPPRDVL